MTSHLYSSWGGHRTTCRATQGFTWEQGDSGFVVSGSRGASWIPQEDVVGL